MSYHTNKLQSLSNVICVDESGTLGKDASHNIKYPFFIMGFCYFNNPKHVMRMLRRLLYTMQRNKVYPPSIHEIKFQPWLSKEHNSQAEIDSLKSHYSEIRCKVAEILSDNVGGIFAGVVDKLNMQHNLRKPTLIRDYMFTKSLEKHLFPYLKNQDVPFVICDSGILPSTMQEAFTNNVKSAVLKTWPDMGKSYSPKQNFYAVNSITYPGIWTSDFVAGAFYHKFQYNDSTYIDHLKSKFIGNGYEMF